MFVLILARLCRQLHEEDMNMSLTRRGPIRQKNVSMYPWASLGDRLYRFMKTLYFNDDTSKQLSVFYRIPYLPIIAQIVSHVFS